MWEKTARKAPLSVPVVLLASVVGFSRDILSAVLRLSGTLLPQLFTAPAWNGSEERVVPPHLHLIGEREPKDPATCKRQLEIEMKILGIHDGHNSGATLLVDGKIVAAICEERLSRTKNELGYPRNSIDEVLRIADIAPNALDQIVYASNFMHTADHLARAAEWYRAGLDDQLRDAQRDKSYLQAVFDKRRDERIAQAAGQLGIADTKVSFVEHHLAHGAAAYYGSPFDLDEPILILTCDGAGDGLSATVAIGNGTDIERIAETPRAASLGKVYSRVTYALGLTPWEHEYKVMGLAPYAERKYGEEVRDILNEHLMLSEDGLSFALAGELQSSYIYEFLRDRLERKPIRCRVGRCTDVYRRPAQAMGPECCSAYWNSQDCLRRRGVHECEGKSGHRRT